MNWGTDPKDKKKWLEKALREGKISQDYYNSKIKGIEEEIRAQEKKETEKLFTQMFEDNPTMELRNRHIVIKLNCPDCGTQGENTFGKEDFKILGKDRQGFIYFECPNCLKHLKYDSMTGRIKTQKGLLGFLFGRYGSPKK